MTDATEPHDLDYGETWVYESLLGTVPGLNVSGRTAIALQFVGFEVAILLVAAVYDLRAAIVPGTVAVLVATIGSWLMLRFSHVVRDLPTPQEYRRLLFGSSIDVVLGVLAFVALVTYLFVIDPRGAGLEGTLLVDLFGIDPPPIAVALALLVLWDVVYRIGTCWWASVVGLWRSLVYEFEPNVSRRYRRVDAINVVFAAVQLLLVPFVVEQPVLLVVLVGHVVAVAVVTLLAIGFQR
ncbi:hypothetical protein CHINAEXTREME_03860 [Halobiforma lacisalsi AJ5]|uniref:Uncharacterized protein n=1 Tax=Natronobacterium lacisalsi AJ5 TaxID=358396 RepID=M0LM73_NATLA|nr:hypothetical protein [Halobiforma lacisalsi]APW96956.1 hypothetical protein CHINAEXTREME_03860 [Halobiforma lacisalsi AJ5]EMA34667.1 hypothetical protein C445_07095 [Halobiforma lacisalsi AJ5]